MTVALSPRMSLWLLELCSYLRMVASWSGGWSVILLPQSRGFEDGVLCLGVSDGGVVSYVRVGVDERVWADLAVVPDYDRSS